jgi:hypothetical protein
MTRPKNILFSKGSVATILCLIIISLGFYFVVNFSSTHKHLRDYSYDISELQNNIIDALKMDTAISCTLTDTTGPMTNRSYYIDIKLRQNGSDFLFNTVCKNVDTSKSVLGLVGAFNLSTHIGGYKDNNDQMRELISLFETQIAGKIK